MTEATVAMEDKRSQPAATGRATATRERIIDAALRLFADRGYRGTTVGDIESAAGLAPRSGALYQHFAGKEEVLKAALEQHVRELESMQSAMELLPLGDLRSELVLLGRWTLQDLTRREPLERLVRKEGAQFPELRDRVREAVHDVPHQRLADWIRRTVAAAGAPEPDCEALALIIAGSMGHFRSLESVYGEKPLDIEDERFLAAWVDVCVAIAAHLGVPVEPGG
jgi:AcrR family transcriptional regulator